MARVKRSAAATQAAHPQPENTPTPDTHPTAPGSPDPRDATIRTLQIALAVVSVITLALGVALSILVFRMITSEPTEQETVPTAEPTQTPLFFANYIAVNPELVKPDAIIVEIHADYQCGWCARAEQIYGQALYELSVSGDIDLRVHMRTLIGDQANDASRRATAAAMCADRVGQFWPYHSIVFSSAPDSDQGFSDTQLRDTFAAGAGLTGPALTQFQACYDARDTMGDVEAMEAEGYAAGIRSTPTFLVNGMSVSFDLQANAEAIQPMTAANLLSALQQVAG